MGRGGEKGEGRNMRETAHRLVTGIHHLAEKFRHLTQKQKLYGSYTVIFCALSGVLLYLFFSVGKTFIWSADGTSQHTKALIFYSRWLRSLVRNLAETHRLEIPSFSFSMGLGADVYTMLHYYVLGDPLNLPVLFLPEQAVLVFYQVLIFVRLFLAGICFAAYDRYVRPDARKIWVSTLIGMLVYAFSGYAVFVSLRHPYFVNPMLTFPLILLGMEKVTREKKRGTLVAGVFLSATSSFYFFYMTVLLAVLYGVIRWAGRKGFWKKFRQVLLPSLLGVLLSSFILVPVITAVLGDERFGRTTVLTLFYPATFWKNVLPGFLSADLGRPYTPLGFDAIGFMGTEALLLSSSRENHKRKKIAFLVLTIFMVLPIFGFMLNGFSYAANRWIWGYTLLIAYLTADAVPELLKISHDQLQKMLVVAVIYMAVVFLIQPQLSKNALFQFVLLFLGIGSISLLEKRKEKNLCFLVSLTIIGIWGNLYYPYSWRQGTRVNPYLSFRNIQKKENVQGMTNLEIQNNYWLTDAKEVKEIAGTGNFGRYSGRNLVDNAGLLEGTMPIQYFWTLSNPNVSRFYNSLAVTDSYMEVDRQTGLDERWSLDVLAGVQYYVTGSPRFLPKGYRQLFGQTRDNEKNEEEADTELTYDVGETEETQGSLEEVYPVYQNERKASLVFSFPGAMDVEDFEKLSPTEKQEALLQTAVVDLPRNQGTKRKDLTFSEKQLPFETTVLSQDVTRQGNSFVVTKKNQTVILTVKDGAENAETYLYLGNLKFRAVSPSELYSEDSEVDPLHLYEKKDLNKMKSVSQKEYLNLRQSMAEWSPAGSVKIGVTFTNAAGESLQKNLFYRSRRNWYNRGQKNFLVNSCFTGQSPVTQIEIHFPQVGIYSFDQLQVISQPMAEPEKNLDSITGVTAEDVDFHMLSGSYVTNRITMTISQDQSSVLMFSLPYSRGWTAYVDGKKTDLKQMDYMYMGFSAEAGSHRVEFRYETPGRRAGFLMTFAGILCLILTGNGKKMGETPGQKAEDSETREDSEKGGAE